VKFINSATSAVLCHINVPNFNQPTGSVINDLVHFRRAILEGGAFIPDGSHKYTDRTTLNFERT